MFLSQGSGDLCNRYRPRTFSNVIEQNTVIRSLQSAVLSENKEQTYLFYGEHGTGKTTTARILAMSLNCSNLKDNGDPCTICEDCSNIIKDVHPAVIEMDASDKTSVNDIRTLKEGLGLRPLMGKAKVLILDECHQLSSSAQNALLKISEKPPKGVFFILCSTEPKKILPTLRARSQGHKFTLVSNKSIRNLIQMVATVEVGDIQEDIVDALTEVSEGRPRNALKNLQKAIYIGLGNRKAVLGSLDLGERDPELISLCRLVMKFDVTWREVVSQYKKLPSTIDAETMRRVLAGWFRSCLERARTPIEARRAARALELFVEIFPPVKPENSLVLGLYKAHVVYKNA